MSLGEHSISIAKPKRKPAGRFVGVCTGMYGCWEIKTGVHSRSIATSCIQTYMRIYRKHTKYRVCEVVVVEEFDGEEG